jgi:uncharacterized protein with HEPN domain
MTDKGKKYLSDVLTSIQLIEEFTESTATFDAYQSDKKRKVQSKDTWQSLVK